MLQYVPVLFWYVQKIFLLVVFLLDNLIPDKEKKLT